MVLSCSVRVGQLSLVPEGFTTEKLSPALIFQARLRQLVFSGTTGAMVGLSRSCLISSLLHLQPSKL
jgi:hypothetical protein